MEPVGVFLGVAKGAWAFAKFVWRKFFPSKVGYPLAPSNILEVIGPYIYREKVIELLGQPHSSYGGTVGYRFANALLQVNYEGDAVDSVVLVAISLRWPNRFRVFPLEFEIGSSTYAEVCTLNDDGTINLQVDHSSKFYTRWKQEYFGFPGRYMHYGFAMIEAAVYPAVKMPKGDIEHGMETEGEVRRDRLINPGEARFNAVMVSRSEKEYFQFTWNVFS